MEADKVSKSKVDDLVLRVLKLEAATLANNASGGGFSNKGGSYRMPLIRSCALKIINIIKDNLGKENLELFEKSCFGHLLKMNPLRFQGRLVLQLLLHMDMSASNKERLVFNIKNTNMEFGKCNFRDITGLHFTKLNKATTTSSSIHAIVFQGRPSIMLKDVGEAFHYISRRDEGKGELTLKLALLYCLYGILLAGSQIKKIDLKYIHLIEDLEEFNAFPWGELAYQFLASSMISARLRLDGSKATRLDIHGFCFALQVWAYEKVPDVAPHCANNLGNLTPQILRWSATKIIRFDGLKKFFDDEAHFETRPSQGDDMLRRNFVPITKSSKVEEEEEEEEYEEETENKATCSTFGCNSVSMVEASDEHVTLKRSSAETKRVGALTENPALDTLQLLMKEYREFEMSELGYEKIKALFERLLNPREHLKLWISYAKYEASGMEVESDIPDKRECFERARAVFERGLGYINSCAPKLKAEKELLLDEWIEMDSRFNELDDVDLVPAKLKRTRHA